MTISEEAEYRELAQDRYEALGESHDELAKLLTRVESILSNLNTFPNFKGAWPETLPAIRTALIKAGAL